MIFVSLMIFVLFQNVKYQTLPNFYLSLSRRWFGRCFWSPAIGGWVITFISDLFKGALTYFLGCVAKEYVCGITWKSFATHRSFYNTALVINIEIEQ